MLTDSETYKRLAEADEQYAQIKVELGGFGLLQDDPEIVATWGEDEVVSCSISCTIGDGGSFGIGSTESCECSLTMLTDAVKPYLNYIEQYDYRVSYGYTDKDTDVTEWLVMGIFATDRSLITREGMNTTITLYDALYWLDGTKYSCPSTTRGTSMLVRDMLDDVCAAGGLEVAEESYDLIPDGMALTMYRPRTGSVRSAIGDVAAALFCNATVYDNKLHLVRIPTPPQEGDVGATVLTPDDFMDVPSYDFAPSAMARLTSSVTQTFEYTATSESDLVAPSYELIPVTTANCKTGKLKGFSATKNQKSGKKGSYYVLRLFKPKGAAKMCGIANTDDSASCKWASATAKSGTMKGKSLTAVYKAGRMLGVYVCSGVSAVGRGAFNLDRYGKRAYLAGKSTKWFPAYTDASTGKSYKGTFAASITNLNGPGFEKASNKQVDWSKVSEWHEDDIESSMSFPGPDGAPEFSWSESGEGEVSEDGNSIELDTELWADEGTVNSLTDSSAINSIEADFTAICANANLPFSYVGSSTQMFGRNYIGLGDAALIEDVYGDTYAMLVMSATYEYGGGITCEFGCEGLETDTGASTYAGSSATSTEVGEVSNATDKLADKVDDVKETVSELKNDQASMAKEMAKIAIESADELDSLSRRIQVDSLAAGQMASEAYDTVSPITEAMKSALDQTEQQAHELTAVKESDSKTVEVVNSLAKAVATYSYETEKSVVAWRQTYTASQDAWASDDAETQAKIKAAYAKLYGDGGTADAPTEDSAQGKLNSAKAANVTAAQTEAQMQRELASAKAYQTSCNSSLTTQQAAYEKALANYEKLKKKTSVKKRQIDAAWTALQASIARRDEAQAAVTEADTRVSEAETNYATAQAALATAEKQVADAADEVETAMTGIHEVYSSCIEQTAKGITLTASKVESQGTQISTLQVNYDSISSTVEGLKSATNLVQTETGWTWNIVDKTARSDASSAASTATSAYSMAYNIINGTGTLTLGGSATAIVMGGDSSWLYLCAKRAYIKSNKSGHVRIGPMATDTTSTTAEIQVFHYKNGSDSGICVNGNDRWMYFDQDGLKIYKTYGSNLDTQDRTMFIKAEDGTITTSGNVTTGGCTMWPGGRFQCGSSSYGIECAGTVSGTKLISTNPGTNTNSANVFMNSYGYLQKVTSSSKRYKHDITDVTDETLDPVKLYDIPIRQYVFNDGYIDENDELAGRTVIGLIAEEVAEHYPIAAYNNGDGQVENWNERYIIPPMLALIQQQKALIDDLTARIEKLEGGK